MSVAVPRWDPGSIPGVYMLCSLYRQHVLLNELTYAGSGLKTRPVARAPMSVTRTNRVRV